MELGLRVSELFYSIQGEGGRAGEPSLFIRLQGCSAQHACYASGVRCDTEFESGAPVALPELAERLVRLQGHLQDQAGPGVVRPPEGACRWVVWTGGEPLDQLRPEHLAYFAGLGYMQALETSGVRPLDVVLARAFDWLTVSPKVAEHVLAKHFPALTRSGGYHLDELRYVRHAGQGIPVPALKARLRYLSPHSNGLALDAANVAHCARLCLEHPLWKLSLQQHKIWSVL